MSYQSQQIFSVEKEDNYFSSTFKTESGKTLLKTWHGEIVNHQADESYDTMHLFLQLNSTTVT